MIEVNALLFTLLAEGSGLLSIILIIWVVLTIRKKRKDKVAATKLVNHVKKHADDRLESIKLFLSTSAGLELEALQLGVKKIDRLEKDFFTHLIRLYIKKDGDILSQMDERMDEVVNAYKEAVAENSGVSAQVDEESLNKIGTLEKENQALVDELKITKSTMGNMMSEFNTMFNGGNDTVQTSKEALQSTVGQLEEQGTNTDGDIVMEEPTEDDIVIESAEKNMTNNDIADDALVSQNVDAEASAPKSMSESEDDFGSIVTSDDVDDILDGIDLSKEIDD